MDAGALVAGRYRLERCLGRGGMGEVWAAHDDALGRSVAVKIVLAALDGDATMRARLRREARTAAPLQHPNITRVYDIDEHEGHPFFVMELLEGSTFKQLLDEHPGGLPAAQAVDMMTQVARALAYAHGKGVVHRDIKPANLMLAGDGDGHTTVKVCDFGLARYSEATTYLTAPGGILGSPVVMAPEQWLAEPVDARTDLYAFGATLHTLLTGTPPFPGPDQRALMAQHLNTPPPHLVDQHPDLPATLDVLLQNLLAKDPRDRPSSATTVANTLTAAHVADAPPPPGAGQGGERTPPPSAPRAATTLIRPAGVNTAIQYARLAAVWGGWACPVMVAIVALGIFTNSDSASTMSRQEMFALGTAFVLTLFLVLIPLVAFIAGLFYTEKGGDRLVVSTEQLTIRRFANPSTKYFARMRGAVTYRIRWDQVERIVVHDLAEQSVLLAWFRDGIVPAAPAEHHITPGPGGSYTIYGPSHGHHLMVPVDPLRQILPDYVGERYGWP